MISLGDISANVQTNQFNERYHSMRDCFPRFHYRCEFNKSIIINLNLPERERKKKIEREREREK